jgi:RNA recognition motif-containing protein
MANPESHKTMIKSECNVFVRGLEWQWTSQDLRAIFEEFGTVVSAKVCLNENKQSKGFGYVLFNEA